MRAGARAIAIAEPADSRGQALDRHLLGGEAQPRCSPSSSGKSLRQRTVDARDVRGLAGQRGTRNGPLPSQNSGRMKAGTKPGKSKAFSTPASRAKVRMLLP